MRAFCAVFALAIFVSSALAQLRTVTPPVVPQVPVITPPSQSLNLRGNLNSSLPPLQSPNLQGSLPNVSPPNFSNPNNVVAPSAAPNAPSDVTVNTPPLQVVPPPPPPEEPPSGDGEAVNQRSGTPGWLLWLIVVIIGVIVWFFCSGGFQPSHNRGG